MEKEEDWDECRIVQGEGFGVEEKKTRMRIAGRELSCASSSSMERWGLASSRRSYASRRACLLLLGLQSRAGAALWESWASWEREIEELGVGGRAEQRPAAVLTGHHATPRHCRLLAERPIGVNTPTPRWSAMGAPSAMRSAPRASFSRADWCAAAWRATTPRCCSPPTAPG